MTLRTPFDRPVAAQDLALPGAPSPAEADPQPPTEPQPTPPAPPAKASGKDIVRVTYRVSPRLHHRIGVLSNKLAATETHYDWTQSRIVAEGIGRALQWLEEKHGSIPVSTRRLRRGRVAGSSAKSKESKQITLRLPSELVGRLKDAVLFLRARGELRTQNELVEGGVRLLMNEMMPRRAVSEG